MLRVTPSVRNVESVEGETRMSETFQCGDNAALVGYLYDECEAVERAVIAAHVAVCAACTAELEALGSARVQLAAWTPPDAKLGFVITQREAVEPSRFRSGVDRPRVHWFARPLPGWAQLAAACLVFGVGLSLGIVTRHVWPCHTSRRYGSGRAGDRFGKCFVCGLDGTRKPAAG